MSTAFRDGGDVATTVAVKNQKSRVSYDAIKPWLDLPLAAVMLVVSTPIMLLAYLLVRLTSRGPGFYTQERLGLKSKPFTIYKIRTMYVDSERHSGAMWCRRGDRRVTPIGRILRACHIDELPQLVNVLKGEMSLVGPRPERPEFVPQLQRALPNYCQRLNVLPGLTGLAQVQNPPDESLFTVRRKLDFDLCYVEQMSFWLDIRLILATALKCLGVSFVWIGRLLCLPLPEADRARESLAVDANLTSKSIVTENYVGVN